MVLKAAGPGEIATSSERAGDTRVLWRTDLATRYDVDRVTIYRWERANRLPPPDVIMGRRRGRYEATMLAFDRATREAWTAAGRTGPDVVTRDLTASGRSEAQ
jgi:hypothetical protein